MPRFFPTLKNFTKIATFAASGGFLKYQTSMLYIPKPLYGLQECFKFSPKKKLHKKNVCKTLKSYRITLKKVLTYYNAW